MRQPHSLQWRIALAYTALIVISMGAISFYLVGFVRDSYLSNLEERLEQEARLVSETFRPFLDPASNSAPGASLDPSARSSSNSSNSSNSSEIRGLSDRIGSAVEARVTIIARDGTVLADTWEDPAIMDNHAGRPEVRQALIAGLGKSTRFSDTVQRRMLYTAVPIGVDGATVGVARVAVPLSRVQADVNRIITTITFSAVAISLVSIGLAYLLARRASRSVRAVAEGARRLAGGNLEHRVRALSSDETEELAEAFNNMARSLRGTITNLSAERNKLSAVLATMADGVMVLDHEGKIILLNHAAGELLAVDPGESAGKRLAEVARAGELRQLVSSCLKTGAQAQAEVVMLHQRRVLSVAAAPLTEPGSQGAMLTLHDLTQVRRMEESHKEFVSNVSHELRNPLASVKALVETLEDGAVEERAVARDFLGRIHRDVDRMNRLVNDLLELSRLESGQMPLSVSPARLSSLVDEVVSQLAPWAKECGVSLEDTVPDGLPWVEADAERLRQVLVNLLENAIKFTPPSGQVTISGGVQDGFVKLEVGDTGPGIPAAHLPHLFERFYKVDRARSDGGTGLGLAIVRQIVEAHGGRVAVASREGVGSVFSFTIPRP